MKIVIIGGNAAGMAAAAKLRRLDSNSQIIVLEQGPDVSYGSCGIPYYFGGHVSSLEQLIARSREWFHKQDITVHTNHQVVKIDPKAKEVHVLGKSPFRYDKLLLATGAKARSLNLPGEDLKNVTQLRTLADARKLEGLLNSLNSPRICIIGAGYIGLEVAENMRARGLDVTLVQRGRQVLSGLDPEMAEKVHQHLLQKGVDLRLASAPISIQGDGKVEQVLTDDGLIQADLVLITAGIEPATQLAVDTGLEVDDRGALMVDNYLVSSDPDILGAGDCVRQWHRVLEDWTWLPLGDTANKMGRVAAGNILGNKQPFPGVVGTAAVKVFDLDCAHTGIGLALAQEKFGRAQAVQITSRDKAGYYPGTRSLEVRLVVLESGRLVGCQALGGPRAVEIVNIVAAAITAGMQAEDVAWLDLAYAPPYSPVWHPLLIAAGLSTKEGGK